VGLRLDGEFQIGVEPERDLGIALISTVGLRRFRIVHPALPPELPRNCPDQYGGIATERNFSRARCFRRLGIALISTVGLRTPLLKLGRRILPNTSE